MAPNLVMLQVLFDAYDDYPVEADGMSRIIHAKLVELGIKHIMRFGSVENRAARTVFAPHMYLEVPTTQGEAIIDYRARFVLGTQDETVHGVFLRAEAGHMAYTGEAFEEAPLSATVIAFMLAPIPAEMQRKLTAMNR